MKLNSLLLAVASAVPLVHAEYPPPITDVYEIESPVNPNIKIRFKNVDTSICHTTNTSQKQYSGHIVILPSNLKTSKHPY